MCFWNSLAFQKLSMLFKNFQFISKKFCAIQEFGKSINFQGILKFTVAFHKFSVSIIFLKQSSRHQNSKQFQNWKRKKCNFRKYGSYEWNMKTNFFYQETSDLLLALNCSFFFFCRWLKQAFWNSFLRWKLITPLISNYNSVDTVSYPAEQCSFWYYNSSTFVD